MIGSVVAVNPTRGMVALETDDGYSIIEMLGDDPPELGDRIRWQGTTPLGGETVENLTQRCTYDVFFQNHHVSRALLRQQLLLD
jgi:hypothetical protein